MYINFCTCPLATHLNKWNSYVIVLYVYGVVD